MDKNKMKIVDCKVPADKKVNPNGMQWTFQIDKEGALFLNLQRYYGGE